jgi:hypothetical protein
MSKVTFIFSLLFASLSNAQIIVNVQLPPAGMIYKDQLWNLVLVNNNNSIDAAISLDIRDVVTGQTVLSAVSTSFILGKGIKTINLKDVQPVQYNYLAAELSGKYLPLGTYLACYRVIRKDPKEKLPLGDECVTIHISPLSLPLLNTPADLSVLETSYPLFTWLAPGPVDMFENLNYDLLVTEILPGQSPAEAILYNTPTYTNSNLRITSQNYLSSFSKLKAGQQYAWQVTARNGLNYSAQTEVWSFSIKSSDSASAVTSTAGYIELKNKNESSGISYINNDELLVKYYSFDKDLETTVRFFSSDGKPVKKVKQKTRYGDNFLRFRLTNEFKKKTVYLVQITDLNKNIYSANFSMQ